MQDLDVAKSLLKKSDYTLVIVKNGRVLCETDASGIRGLLMAVKKIGADLKGSSVADKIVGEAAAQLCAYSNVSKVFAVTLSRCGKDLLEKNGIYFEYEDLVPHILDLRKADLCPFEKLVSGSSTPNEAYERLRKQIG